MTWGNWCPSCSGITYAGVAGNGATGTWLPTRPCMQWRGYAQDIPSVLAAPAARGVVAPTEPNSERCFELPIVEQPLAGSQLTRMAQMVQSLDLAGVHLHRDLTCANVFIPCCLCRQPLCMPVEWRGGATRNARTALAGRMAPPDQ